jgi:AcrR family transcriptional regulator
MSTSEDDRDGLEGGRPEPPDGTDAVEATETKAARTRSAIIDAALRLFRERGYDATTMRAIASEAGVSVGTAYYYFDSKESLIQAFYDRAQHEHAATAAPVLAREVDLGRRILGVMEAWLDVMEVYRGVAPTFFRNASDPASPLSPFSAESTEPRMTAIALWREVVEGSDARVPKKLRDDLRELLWLFYMAHVLLWVHDPTAGAQRTRRVARRTAPLVVRALALLRLPGVRGLLDDALAVVGEVRGIFGTAPDGPSHLR